jgi:phenylalanine ammonia-lyase
MQIEFKAGLDDIVANLLESHFRGVVGHRRVDEILPNLIAQVNSAFDRTATMDAAARLHTVAGSICTPLLDALSGTATPSSVNVLTAIQGFRENLGEQGLVLLQRLQREYLDGSRGRTPASRYMGRTKAMYEFVRVNLGIRMHGLENLNGFEGGMRSTESVGQNVTKIYEVRLSITQDILI